MPTPAQRTRSFARNRVTTPGGRVRTHYVKKKPAPARCASCGKLLHGVPRGLPKDIAKLTRSKKRPDRPYGGNLCSPCTKNMVKSKNMERWEHD